MQMSRYLFIMIGMLSIFVGIVYMNRYDAIFGFNFLGPEQGSEREKVKVWGQYSVVLGTILLITLAVRSKAKKAINDGMLIIVLILMFIIQLPAFGLWSIVLLTKQWEALSGTLLHGVLLILICAAMFRGLRD